MNEQKKRLFLIKIAYWLGIVADALWAVGLFFPQIYGMLMGNPDFDPDLPTRLIMGIGGILMTGWTFLLLWAVREPIERRTVILLTASVVIGMFIVTLIGILGGNTSSIWILIKTTILFISMVISYIIAGKMDRDKE
ncbi:hypothetical protein ACFLRP_03145 [Bacteroidota bacterium]